MIIGIIASQDIQDDAPAIIGYDLDFKAETYIHNGASIALSDILTHTERVAAGSGLAINQHAVGVGEDLTDKTHSIGPLLNFVRNNRDISCVMTVLPTLWSGTYNFFLALDETLNDSINLYAIGLFLAYYESHSLFDENPIAEREVTDVRFMTAGQRSIIGFNREDGHVDIAVNGRHVATLSDDVVGLVLDTADIAWHTGTGDPTGSFMERLQVRPLMSLGALLAATVIESRPANDDFADAITISSGETVNGHNYLATREDDEPAEHAGDPVYRGSVWYNFIAPSTGDFTLTLTGELAPDRLDIEVYTGASLATLVSVASNVSEPYDELTFSATEGVTYRIAAAGYQDFEGHFTLALAAS